jgi:hypothetical protein
LLDTIDDPFLQALGTLALAWTAPIGGDFSDALREALDSLERFRGQAEPYWTAVAVLSAGYMEAATGRYGDAAHHLREAQDMAERSGYPWLAAWSRVQLGTVAALQGRPGEARELLEEGLDLTAAGQTTRNVTLRLVAFARLAFAEGDPEQAALAAGAADGLRRRAGLQAWPMVRQGEATLTEQLRQALGTSRFHKVYDAGAALSRREAVTAVQGRRASTRA